MSDCWVVGRKSDQREFFVILNQKNANLIEINGKFLLTYNFRQLTALYFKKVLWHPHVQVASGGGTEGGVEAKILNHPKIVGKEIRPPPKKNQKKQQQRVVQHPVNKNVALSLLWSKSFVQNHRRFVPATKNGQHVCNLVHHTTWLIEVMFCVAEEVKRLSSTHFNNIFSLDWTWWTVWEECIDHQPKFFKLDLNTCFQ